METIKSYRNPFTRIDDKICESCRYGNYAGWPLTEVFVQDENRKIWLCGNCLDRTKADSIIDMIELEKNEMENKEEADILENRDMIESPDS